MSLKNWAVGVACAACLSGSAFAIPLVLVGSGGPPTPFFTADFSGSHASSNETSFIDTWTFSLLNAYSLIGSAISFQSNPNNFEFTSIVLSGASGPFSFSKSAPATSTPDLEVWTLGTPWPVALGAGDYYLKVAADLAGPLKAGSYGGTLEMTLVPEPAGYMLMLAGLGIMGFMAKRRRVI